MGETAKAHREELRAVAEKMEAMRLEVERLRAEREKLEEVAAEAERGTAKGRTYEEAVVDAIDAIAGARGDVAEGVGDEGAAGRGKKGDVLASLDACAGPARGRVVFEAKDTANLSRNKALEYLDEAMARRDADYAVLVVPCEHLPAKTQTLREFNGDKLFVGWDPEDGPLALELAYGLARARVLARRGDADGLDADALRAEAERATQAMEDVRRIKSQLTGATTSIEEARKILDVMAGTVRGHLAQIDALVSSAV
jgi:hypothetical protein